MNISLGKGKYAGIAILGAIIVCVGILGVCGILPGTFPINSNEPVVEQDEPVVAQSAGFRTGEIITSTAIDRSNCPVSETLTFANDDTVHVTAVDSNVPEDTDIFVRLYHDNQPIEDTPVITSDQEYIDSCVNFTFEPDTFTGFESGMYEAEFIVNGNPVDTVEFEVQ